MRAMTSVLAGTICTLMLAVSLAAASGPNPKTNQKTPRAEQRVWPRETVAGKIMMVDPDQKLLIVRTPDGVPFDMVVTARTRIRSGNQALTLNDLSQDVNKSISVTFRPEGRGDVARSIQING